VCSCVETAQPIEIPFGRGAEPCIKWELKNTHGRHLAITTERSALGADADVGIITVSMSCRVQRQTDRQTDRQTEAVQTAPVATSDC